MPGHRLYSNVCRVERRIVLLMNDIQMKTAISNRRASDPGVQTIPASARNALKSHDFFVRLSDDLLERLAFGLKFHRCAPGDIIIQEGTLGKSLFFIISGSVQVVSEKSETTLAELGRGAFFGEIGAFYDTPRTATVESLGPSTVAVLSRDNLLYALDGHHDTLAEIIKEAQVRYLRTKPYSVPLGHRADAHYQISTLGTHFPFCRKYSDEYMLNVILCGEMKQEKSHTIICFPNSESIIMVVSGKVILEDPFQPKNNQEYGPGSIAKFSKDCSIASSLSTRGMTSFFKLDELAYKRFISGDPLSRLEERLQKLSLSESTDVATTTSHPTLNAPRKSLKTTVLWHDQEIHGPIVHKLSLPAPVQSTSDMQSNQEEYLVFCDILQTFNIDLTEAPKFCPTGNVSSLNFRRHYRNDINDNLLDIVTRTFGNKIKSIDISGCQIGDEGMQSIANNCIGLKQLWINDCVRITSNGLGFFLEACQELEVLSCANCLAVDDVILTLVAKLPLKELNISFCRNVSTFFWKSIVALSKTIESLIMHRIVAMNEENVMSVSEEKEEGEATYTFDKLHHLDLSDCAFLTSQGLREILRHMPSLKSLSLSFCAGLDETVAKAFNASNYHSVVFIQDSYSPRPNLISLDLSFCTRAVTDNSIKAMVKILPNLQSLSLRGSKYIGKTVFDYLLDLKRLVNLNVSGCLDIDSQALETAASAGDWKLLTSAEKLDDEMAD